MWQNLNSGCCSSWYALCMINMYLIIEIIIAAIYAYQLGPILLHVYKAQVVKFGCGPGATSNLKEQ